MRCLTLALALTACSITGALAQSRSETYEFHDGQLERQYPTPGVPNRGYDRNRESSERGYRRDYGEAYRDRRQYGYGDRWRDRDEVTGSIGRGCRIVTIRRENAYGEEVVRRIRRCGDEY